MFVRTNATMGPAVKYTLWSGVFISRIIKKQTSATMFMGEPKRHLTHEASAAVDFGIQKGGIMLDQRRQRVDTLFFF